jgi:hypothetical protein
MRLARHVALLLVLLAMAVSGPVQEREVSRASNAVNALMPRLEIALPRPFLCDSLEAIDCFQMFARALDADGEPSITTIAWQPAPGMSEPAWRQSMACGLDIPHLGDRCRLR